MRQLLNLWSQGDNNRDNGIVKWNDIQYSFSFLNDLKCHWDFFDFESKHCFKHLWGKLDQDVEVDLEELWNNEGKTISVTLKKKGKVEKIWSFMEQ